MVGHGCHGRIKVDQDTIALVHALQKLQESFVVSILSIKMAAFSLPRPVIWQKAPSYSIHDSLPVVSS